MDIILECSKCIKQKNTGLRHAIQPLTPAARSSTVRRRVALTPSPTSGSGKCCACAPVESREISCSVFDQPSKSLFG